MNKSSRKRGLMALFSRDKGDSNRSDDPTTRLLKRSQPQTDMGGQVERPTALTDKVDPQRRAEPETQLYLGAKKRSAMSQGSAADDHTLAPGRNLNFMSDPVVGWLVVVDGPGKGSALQIGYGNNSLGRGPEERVRVDFGDANISRHQHAIVTYEPKARQFFVQPGGSQNLTYLGEKVVLSPTELEAGQDIVIGETTLRFVPFCSGDFDWQA